MAPWFVAAAVGAGAMAVPGLEAQEVDSLPEVELAQDPVTVEDAQSFDVRLGGRMGLAGHVSPGVSLQLTWNRNPSLSLQILAHNTLGYIGVKRKRRGEWYAGRIAMDFGGDDNIGFFAFGERGRGAWFSDSADTPNWYRFTGIGAGARLTVDRVTASAELALGLSREGDHGPYIGFGLGIQLRLWQLGL